MMNSEFRIVIILSVISSWSAVPAHPVMDYASYLGGNGHDWISDLCIDSTGAVYVTGSAYSRNFPTTPNAFMNRHAGGDSDVFIAKFSPDGVLVFSTLLGGNDYDGNSQIEIDSEGNIIVTGVTRSRNFPTTSNVLDSTFNGDLDIFVCGFDPECETLLFSTFLGGRNQDHHPMIVVDTMGDIYVAGPTRSPDFPTTEDAYDRTYNGTVPDGYYGDIFLSKISKHGERLLYSSFIGGEKDETVFGITLDPNGIVYLTGLTTSITFPNTHQIYGQDYDGNRSVSNDAFLMALDCSIPSFKFATIFGGSANEQGDEVVCDQQGYIYVVGNTSSKNYPTTQGAYGEFYFGGGSDWKSGDIFVSKFYSSGTDMVFSTYIGGTGDEGWCDLAINQDSSIIIGGGTSSPDFPVTTTAIGPTYQGGDEQFVYRDAFLCVLDSPGDKLSYSTFLGGSGDDNIFVVAADPNATIYIGGLTTSHDFLMTSGAFDRTFNGDRDAFLMRLKENDVNATEK